MQTEVKTIIYRSSKETSGADGKQKKENFVKKLIASKKSVVIFTAVLAVVVAVTVVVVSKNRKVEADDMELSRAEAVWTVAELDESAGMTAAGDVADIGNDANFCEEAADAEFESAPAENEIDRDSTVTNDASDDDGLDDSVIGIDDFEETIIMSLLAENEDEAYFPVYMGLEASDDNGASGIGAATENNSNITGIDSVVNNSNTTENDSAAADSASDITEIADTEEAHTETHLDEIEEMVKKADAPEDKPSKLPYKYNTKMMLNLTGEEITILERIVEAEATDEDVYGKMLVANVIINRVNSKSFPNSVEKVVFQKIGRYVQFSPISDGRYYSVKVTKSTKEAVQRVLAGEDYSNGALYFFMRSKTSSSKASWFDNSLDYLFKYGCHEFYKE